MILMKKSNFYFQEVNEFNQGKWYKKMYETLHKAKNDGKLKRLR
jgi:hypothetical protein